MIYVEGVTVDGVAYSVYIGTSEDELIDLGIVMPSAYGETVLGTPTVIAQLRVSDNQPVALTPTGPERPLSATDDETVLAWLRANTTNVSVATTTEAASMLDGGALTGVNPEPPAPAAPDNDEIVY